MAGQGTGLPGTTGAEITPLVDLARSAGTAEAADADALLTLAGIARDTFDTFAKPRLVERATQEAEADAAAGRFRQRMAVTEVGEAYNQALRQGTLARLSTQADTELDAMFAANLYDPDGFSLASAEARSRFIQSAPPELAVTLGQAWDQRQSGLIGRVREARAGRDLEAAKGDIEARTDRLVRESIANAASLPLDQAMAAIQPALTEIAVGLRDLENPAFGMGEEAIAARNRAAATELLTGVVGNEAARLLATDGFDAAMAFVGTIMEDESLPLDQEQRQSAFEASRARVQGQYAIDEQRRNAETQELNWRRTEAARLTDEAAAHIALHGEPMDGVTIDRIREMGGEAAVRSFYAATADAYDFHREFPNLGAMTPEQFADARRSWESERGRGGPVGGIPDAITSDEQFDALVAAISLVETPGRSDLISADPDGAGPAGGGAVGDMQLLSSTARNMAARLGIPFDESRLRTDVEYNQRLGREYLTVLMDRYGGDPFLSVTAYHAGEGNVDRWIARFGDPRTGTITRDEFVRRVEAAGNPYSARYPRLVSQAMGGGEARASWDAVHSAARAQFNDDPASYVGRDPMVRSQYQAWEASGWNDGQGFVEASLAAQARAGVAPADRRSLPLASLVQIARRVDDYEGQDLIDYANGVMSRFGSQGERVWQDVMRVRGHTNYAAMAATAATRAAATGGPAPSPAAVREAQRGEAISQAASGTVDVRQMSDEDVLRAAGLQ